MNTFPLAMVAQVAHGDTKKRAHGGTRPHGAHPATTHLFFNLFTHSSRMQMLPPPALTRVLNRR